MGFTADIAAETSEIDFDRLPPEVVERTRHMLLDWTAVSVAGSQTPSARAAQTIAQQENPDGRCTILGTDLRAGAQSAALANAIAAHALDYDDGNRWAGTHPSAPVISAVAALADDLEATGEQLIEAIVAGVQALCVIGFASGPEHYARGFHTTGTIGTFGASAGCARLLGLDRNQTAHALSLAATQAAGLKAMFGTMGKHLNAGHAAASGLRAARLVEAGFDAPLNAIEAPQGFASTQSPSLDPGRRKPDARYGVEQVIFKRYACCADTHSAIEGIRAIAARRPLSAPEVAGVDLAVADGLLDVCDITAPSTGTEGKFSVRYATALAIAGHAAGPGDFTDAAVRRPDLVALTGRIRVHADHHGHAADPITVTVHFADGTTDQATVNPLIPVSDTDLTAQWDALVEKANGLLRPLLHDRTARLVQAIRSLPTTTAREVISATIPSNPDND